MCSFGKKIAFWCETFFACRNIQSSLLILILFFLQEIPPFETKGVMRASFSSRDADNHTAFIRIKTNAPNEDQFIILPVEVEVTSGESPNPEFSSPAFTVLLSLLVFLFLVKCLTWSAFVKVVFHPCILPILSC